MMVTSWLRWLMALPSSRRSTRRGSAPPRSCRPRLEALEDRLTPADHTWTGAVSNLWSNAGNWIGGSPAADTSFPTLIFPSGAANLSNTNDISGSLGVAQIILGGGYALGGIGIHLFPPGINSGGISTINLPLTLSSNNGSVQFFVSGGGSLILGGAISSDFSQGLTKFGSGNLVLSGANTYTGATTVTEGELTIRNATALGTPNSTFVRDGASLAIREGITVVGESLDLGNFDFDGAGTTATLRNVTGTNTWTGPIELHSNAALDVVGTTTLLVSGVVQGTDGDEFQAGDLLTKSGTGTLELSRSNTYTAFTDVAAGTLRIRSASALGSPVAGTRVAAGATLALQEKIILDETFGVLVGNESLELNGTGVGSGGALRNLGGGNSWAGPVTLATTATAAVDGDFLDLRGRVAGAGGLTKTGPGLLSYTGTQINTYTGATLVSAGTLLVNKTLNASATTVANQAVLGGNGITKGVTLQNGVLSPGSASQSTAILRTQGNVSMDAASNFDVTLNGATAGANFDQLLVTGRANLGGANLRVTGNGGAVNGTFVILQATSGVIGTFNGLPENTEFFLANGVKMRINYTATQVLLSHRDTAPAFQNRQVTTPIDEGSRATVTGRITEPDTQDTFFLEVNWGDGAPTQKYHFAPGTPRDIAITHLYRDDRPGGTPEDVYTIDLFWHDQHGLGNRGKLDVTVRNVAPEVFAGGAATVRADHLFKRSGFFGDPGHDRWTATVDYGDGSGPQSLHLSHDNEFKLRHRYKTPGTYHVVVTVKDDDGGVGTVSFDVTVLPHQHNPK